MSVFCQITIELKAAASVPRFYDIMEKVITIAEAEGWKLHGAFTHSTGRLYTIIDIWELDDYNHYGRGAKAIFQHSQFPEISAVFAETVDRETVVFLDRAPYSRN
jgi:hypothetical protein